MVIYSVVASVMMANMMVNDQEHTSQDESHSSSRSTLNLDSNGPIFSLYDGTVRGTVDNSTGALQFFGLPYAEPPTGSNRFRPPIVSVNFKKTVVHTFCRSMNFGNQQTMLTMMLHIMAHHACLEQRL